jgi:hypothetical protein
VEVRISTGEIFIVHTICVLVRPIDLKPPITITPQDKTKKEKKKRNIVP